MNDANPDAARPKTSHPPSGVTLPGWDEAVLLSALRAGDEVAFRRTVDHLFPAMVGVASMYVSSRAVAEEVVQETWLAVLQGLDRFEGRSSLKTWIFRILTNRAQTRGVREHRSVPFSSLVLDEDEPAVPGERFRGRWRRHPGAWSDPPEPWSDLPAEILCSNETRGVIDETIGSLVPAQRTVIRLRDIEGWTSADVCDALGLTEVNQRVLLHRARAKVRAALEGHLGRVGARRSRP